MNIGEWNAIDWQERLKIRKRYGITPSAEVKTISAFGETHVEQDGITEEDLKVLEGLTKEQVKQGISPPTKDALARQKAHTAKLEAKEVEQPKPEPVKAKASKKAKKSAKKKK